MNLGMHLMRRGIVVAALACLTVALTAWLPGALSAAAEAAPPTPSAEQVNSVAKDLWCPLCSGVRLDNCDLQACVQMREVIAQKLAAGEGKDQIKTYFVQQYGEVVLGMPKSPLPFILPPLLGALALGWVIYFVVVWVRRRPAPAHAATRGAPARPGADDYLQRVDDELKKYE